MPEFNFCRDYPFPVVSYKRKYVHEVYLPKKSVARLTDRIEMTIAVDWDAIKTRKANIVDDPAILVSEIS